MEEKTLRWFFVAFAAVLITIVVGCTVAYVVDPHEFNCEMDGRPVNPGCGR